MKPLDWAYYAYHSNATIPLYDRLIGECREYALAIARSYRLRDPEDTAQDIAEQVMTRLSQFSNKSLFSTWFHSFCRHHCFNAIDSAQKEKAELVDSLPERDTSAEYLAPARDHSALPEDIRVIVNLLAQGFSREETAKCLCYSRRTLERKINNFVNSAQKMSPKPTKGQ